MKKIKLYIFTVLLLIASCTVQKPTCDNISNLDYNKRCNVKNAHYIKEPTMANKAAIIGGALTGAYLGSKSNLITYQRGTETKNLIIANVTIGAVAGYATVQLFNFIVGQGKYIECKNSIDWANEVNKDFIVISPDDNTNFRVMHNSIESNYIVKNIKDVYDFHTAFPNSNYSNDVIKKSISVVSRAELLELINLYPNCSNLLDIKKEYVNQSSNINDLFDAFNKFPETKIDIEKNALVFTNSLIEIDTYIKRFPNGNYYTKMENKSISYINTLVDAKYYDKIFKEKTYGDIVEEKIAKTVKNTNQTKKFDDFYKDSKFAHIIINNLYPKSSRNNLETLIQIYPNNTLSQNMRVQYLALSNTITQCQQVAELYPSLATDATNKAATYVNSLSTFNNFKENFQDTVIINNSITKLYPNFNRSDLYKLINNNQEYPDIYKLKLKYLELSKTIAECKEVAQKLPEISDLAETKAVSLCVDISSCNNYLNYFPNGVNEDKIKNRLVKFNKKAFNEYVTKIKTKIKNKNYLSAKNYFDKAKEYIITNEDRVIYNKLYETLFVSAKVDFDAYISSANSYISRENFDNAINSLNNAKNCILNNNDQQTYNSALSSYKYKYNDYVQRNTNWTWNYKYNYKNNDGTLVYNLTIYKNSSKYKEKTFFITYHPYEDVYNKAYYDVYFSFREHIVTFYPDQKKGYVSCGSYHYYGTSLDDCVDFAIKACINQKYK